MYIIYICGSGHEKINNNIIIIILIILHNVCCARARLHVESVPVDTYRTRFTRVPVQMTKTDQNCGMDALPARSN